MQRFEISRRGFVRQGVGAVAAIAGSGLLSTFAAAKSTAGWDAATGQRPAVADRKFTSAVVEEFISGIATRIGDPTLRRMFVNCFPNTLDTTVQPGEFDGHPDTAVITGDIPAMWLRDSSAQVWPYLPLAATDAALRKLLEGVIRRQTRCLLIDPYANAFMADLTAPALSWSLQDRTEMKQGVGERKYELDSLCYPIRLAHGYWKSTGDVAPFDAQWQKAMALIVETMRVQQRKAGEGPYRFARMAENAVDTLTHGLSSPAKPVGMIACCFRPSDDACTLPFHVPANLFAVASLKHLAEMAEAILHDAKLATDASALAAEVSTALHKYAVAKTDAGTIWAYEVDGFGGHILMDDAGAPSLLGLPYLKSSPDPALYARTRAWAWSTANPWFIRGSAGEGIGSPHIGRDTIWPMSQTMFALTSTSPAEIARMLQLLKAGSADSGFIHESYNKDNARDFTRPWFAWANGLFGEMIVSVAEHHPELLR